MKRLIITFIVFSCLHQSAFCQDEVIAGFEEKDLPVLNEELRTQSAKNISQEADIKELQSDVSDLQADLSSFVGVPTGGLILWATDTAPTNFLMCYGQAVSRTTYAALFAIIGTTYGSGDGSTTFNVPDMRGRFPLGQDDMGGSSANRVTDTEADTLGSSKGAETHTLSTGEMPAHTHTTPLHTTDSGSGTSQLYLATTAITTGDTAVMSTDSAGGGSAHNIMNPYLTLNYIIKT